MLTLTKVGPELMEIIANHAQCSIGTPLSEYLKGILSILEIRKKLCLVPGYVFVIADKVLRRASASNLQVDNRDLQCNQHDNCYC
jgi:hypothetical protein